MKPSSLMGFTEMHGIGEMHVGPVHEEETVTVTRVAEVQDATTQL